MDNYTCRLVDGQFYKLNTAFCYIQLKKSIPVLHPPAKFCTKSSQIVPACTISSHPARLVTPCTRKSSHHVHFCTDLVCSRRSSCSSSWSWSSFFLFPTHFLRSFVSSSASSSLSWYNIVARTWTKLLGLVLKQFAYEVKKHIDRWVRILFQKHTSSLALIIADFILADQICPALLRS